MWTPALRSWVLGLLCVGLGVAACKSESGGADGTGGDAGGAAGTSGSGGGGSGGGGRGGVSGASGKGGAGGNTGGLAGSAGAGGSPIFDGGPGTTDRDASVADAPALATDTAPPPIACKGAYLTINPDAGVGSSPESLRTDVTVARLLDTPGNATRLARDPVSKTIYLLTQKGEVRTVDLVGKKTDPAYSAAAMKLPTDDEALGMAFTPDGTLYVVSHVLAAKSANTSKATIVRGVPGAGGTRTWSVFATSAAYPRSNTYFDHEWSGIVSSADGKFVYVNCGSRTDHGEVQTANGQYPGTREVALTARILRLPTDQATPLAIPDDEAQLMQKGWVFARGTRNSFDLEFAPNGDLLAGENGPDGDYHEELNWLREGHHYGFPWRMGNEDNQMSLAAYDPAKDPRLQESYGATRMMYWRNDPQFPAKPAGVTFEEPIFNTGPDADEYRGPQPGPVSKASATGKAFGTFSDHGSPLGLTFDPGAGALCGEFSGKAFILRFGIGGSPNDFEPGRDLLFLDLKKTNGVYTTGVRRIVRNFKAPIDALIDGDKLYVLDRSSNATDPGALYQVNLPNGK